ncbi:hypothetical protein N665_0071s0068 [Sinapis alba]|nr:hypothetical protein N665_0071s0068 [Sinapis alba]
MESEAAQTQFLDIPERIFAAGEEPAGVRVTPYHKACGIRQILNALDSEEVDLVRLSPFGKMVEIADKPTFSGRFGRYIISRQLKVTKKHEAWFLFAGKPIRFSLREFAVVTGLNCQKFPSRTKKRSKKHITEKPYWGELFGTLKEVHVSSVIRMLKKKTIADKELRLKHAYLALLASVILPTTHTPHISQDHAELIKDLNAFFAYPWGRVSFDMLMCSIKERKEVSLAQNTIALKGFVLSLQLVMVEAVPSLTEVVQDGSSSGSEGESGEEDDNNVHKKSDKKSISPGHARDIDAAGQAQVCSIISHSASEIHNSPELEWSDDEEDAKVENMVALIQQRFHFSTANFCGGLSKLELNRLREEAKAESLNRKSSKTKTSNSASVQDGLDSGFVATIVKDCVQENCFRIASQITILQEAFDSFQSLVLSNMKDMFDKLDENVEKMTLLSDLAGKEYSVAPEGTHQDPTPVGSDAEEIGEDAGHPAQQPPREQQTKACYTETNSTLDPDLFFPEPTFSLGLTHEIQPPVKVIANDIVDGEPVAEHDKTISEDVAEAVVGCRKSKRQKVPPRSLLGHYECDIHFLNRARQAAADSHNSGGSIDYSAKFSVLLDKMKTDFCITTGRGTLQSSEVYEIVARTSPLSSKVVDVLMFHISSLFRARSPANQQSASVFLDTQFVAQLSKMYTKFSKVSKKDNFRFPNSITETIMQNVSLAKAERFYFPFNLDKKYWVGICVDCGSWTISVLDCNIALRTDYMMNKEIRPIAQMFPYLLKQVGKQVVGREAKPMALDRPRTIPQHNAITDSAISSILFIQAHAAAGVEVCKCITPDVLDTEAERLVVTLYERNVETL